MDIFCEYVNDFIENNLYEMAEYYELETLWIVKKENSIKILFHFFSWCTNKRYITYRINLAHSQQNSFPRREVSEKAPIKV